MWVLSSVTVKGDCLIRSHRKKEAETDLAGLFYRADKLSRNCFSCPAEGECDWPKEKKNREISF